MAASPSAELTPAQRQALLAQARSSIHSGLSGRRSQAAGSEVDAALLALRASFVTLHIAGRLRGCIGSLEAHAPLFENVAHNAWAAAFRDPRFPPLREDEFEGLEVHISVLTPLSPIVVDSEPALHASLRPGIDGVVLHQGQARSTFLPQVWEQLPDTGEFLRHLRLKAGLPTHYDARASYFRYGVESFGS